MNNNEKFEEIYSRIIENNKDLEKYRIKAKNEKIRTWILRIIFYSIGVILIPILNEMFHEPFKITFEIVATYWTTILSIDLVFWLTKEIRKTEIKEYKYEFQRIIKELLDSFEEKLNYSPKGDRKILNISYRDAKFQANEWRIWKCEDLIEGTLRNGSDFSMADIMTKYESNASETVDVEELDEISHLVQGEGWGAFNGIFAMAQLPKSINTQLYIRVDMKDQKSVLARKINPPFEDSLRVEVDSPEFEKIFDVYCTDKIIAMRLLTSDIMELLVDFKKEIKMDYEITIKDDMLYIRFMSGKTFEPANVMKNSLDKSTLYKYYRILELTFELTNKLIKTIKEMEE